MTVLKEAQPTARKPHRCHACTITIEPGTKYNRQTAVFDGRVYDWIACLPCESLLGDVSDWKGDDSEGVDGEDFYEWATAHQGNDESAAAYMTRYRLAEWTRTAQRRTYADGLRDAATYAQDYLGSIADVAKLQRVLWRFAAVADCPTCDKSGHLPGDGRPVDHHPPHTITIPLLDPSDYDGDLTTQEPS